MTRTLKAKIAGILNVGGQVSRATDGQVVCPLGHGDVDIERCFSCTSLKGTQHDAEGIIRIQCGGRYRPLYESPGMV